MHQLGKAMKERFIRGGSPDDLIQASDFCEKALALCPPEHDDRSSIIEDIHCISGMKATKDKRREAMKFGDAEDVTFSDLARMEWNLWKHTDDITHLASCIAHYRSALSRRPPGHPGRPSSLHNLGLAVLLMAKSNDDLTRLDEAVALLQDCLDLKLKGGDLDSDRCHTLQKLGDAFYFRYKVANALADLEEFGRCYREALELQPDNDHNFDKLSSYHFLKFKRAKQPADGEEAVEFALRALQKSGPKNRAHYTREVATCYVARYMECGEYFEEAIKYLFMVFEFDDHAARRSAFHELSVALSSRIDGKESDLVVIDEGIDYCRKALGTTKGNDAISHPILQLISRLLNHRYEITNDETHLMEAVQHRQLYLGFQTGTAYYPMPTAMTNNLDRGIPPPSRHLEVRLPLDSHEPTGIASPVSSSSATDGAVTTTDHTPSEIDEVADTVITRSADVVATHGPLSVKFMSLVPFVLWLLGMRLIAILVALGMLLLV